MSFLVVTGVVANADFGATGGDDGLLPPAVAAFSFSFMLAPMVVCLLVIGTQAAICSFFRGDGQSTY
jgi:hypothetical protein